MVDKFSGFPSVLRSASSLTKTVRAPRTSFDDLQKGTLSVALVARIADGLPKFGFAVNVDLPVLSAVSIGS